MLRLKKYIKNRKIGNVGTVRIKFEGETFIFNLVSEVKITKTTMNSEIMEQPQAYAFLTMLHKKLIAHAKQVEVDLERVYGERYMFHSTSTKSRFYKDMASYPNATAAKELVKKDALYIEAARNLIKAEEDRDTIEACVKSFEQRAFLLQTLSANNRKERY
jgi:hypothetical protein